MSESILVKLAKALDEKGIAYMIIGGQAVLLYGEPRLTRDIDITLALTPDELSKVLDVVHKLNLKILVNHPESFVKETWVLPAFDESSGFRIDFIFSWTPYEREAIERAKIVKIQNYPVKFASPEDVVIHKVISGRPRDWEDVKSIVRKQKLDLELIRKWLSIFSESIQRNLWDEFEKIYKEEKHGS